MTQSKRKPGRPKKAKRTGRPAKYSGPKQIETAQRRLEALELRKAGYTYRQIGEWLQPPCTEGTACTMVTRALAEIQAATTETVEHVRAMELERLDEIMVKPLEAAKNGDTRAIEAVLKIMDRRAQILGVDAPKKQEHSGPDGGPIPIARVEIVIVDIADPGRADLPAPAPTKALQGS